MKRCRFAFYAMLVVLVPLFAAQACGPDFSPDSFVRTMSPDKMADFAAGKLGVLLPTYTRWDLVAAYRYLSGNALSATEIAVYAPPPHSNDPGGRRIVSPRQDWKTVRASFSTAVPVLQVKGEFGHRVTGPTGTFTSFYENCLDDAFRNAAATLTARAGAWGQASAEVVDWVKGQDAVFANCEGAQPVLPADAPAGSSALLKADRAYQRAAALFYSARFDDAGKAFNAIAGDAASPWHGIAPFLEARCLVRQAFLSNVGFTLGMVGFDRGLMRQAADRLQALLKQDQTGISRQAIQSELDLVRLRVEPGIRIRELAPALAGPEPDPDYLKHLIDICWIFDATLDYVPLREDFRAKGQSASQGQAPPNFSKTYTNLAAMRSVSPLIDWLVTFQSPAPEAKEHALAEWKKSHLPLWLVPAITRATEKDPDAPALITAAAQIDANSPGWETVTYHRIRLLIALGRARETREVFNQTFPQIQAGAHDSSANLFQGLTMRASANLNEFLVAAPRKILRPSSESYFSLRECLQANKSKKGDYDCTQNVGQAQFSIDSVSFFNTQAPLSTLIESANSGSLREQLRRPVAVMAWVRSVLLHDDASAAKLLPLLPAKLQQEAGPGTGFHAVMALLRSPGLRPYLDPGVQRSYSYDFLESYADNWWCADWQTNLKAPGLQPEPVAFLSETQRQQAASELSKLTALKGAETNLGALVLDYANAFPDDKDVPESLFLVLRMIRYGCQRVPSPGDSNPNEEEKRVDAIRSNAARLLRERYPASPWTTNAAPYMAN